MNSLLPDTVSMAETDYGITLLDEKSGMYWSLNGSAALALQELAKSHSLTAAATAVTEKYDVGHAEAMEDIRSLLRELRSAELISDSVSVIS